MKEFAKAMAAAQAKIKSAIKDSDNPAFKSGGKVIKYADLAAIWDACRSALTDNGFCVIQSPNFDGNDVWLETTIYHSSGDSVSGRWPLRPTQNTPQGFGSATTYARRYSLAAMVGVVADADDDGNAASGKRGNEPEDVDADQDPVDEKLQIAKAFVKKAIKEIGACKSVSEVDAWYGEWTKHIVKIKSNYPEEAAILTAAINAQRGSFKAAAE